MSRDIISEYEPLFNPRSVALLGASGTEGKVGRMWMERFVEAGFENLYPVNLKIAGRPSHFHILLPIENNFYDFS